MVTISHHPPTLAQALDALRTRLDEVGEDQGRRAAAMRDATPPVLEALHRHLDTRAWRDRVDRTAALEAALAAETPEAALGVLLGATEERHAPPVLISLWTAEQETPREWLVEGALPADRVGILTGPGGQGKSTMAMQLGLCLAAGDRMWLPRGHRGVTSGPLIMKVAQTPVVYWSAEDEKDEFVRRMARMDMKKPEIDGFFHYADGSKQGPLWAPAAGGSGHTSTLGELTPAGDWIRRYAESVGARLLIIDSLAAAYACSEIDRGLVRAHCGNWDWWARKAGCAVLFIAHPAKSGDYSGSTDWLAASRFMWTLGLQPVSPEDKSDEREAPRLDDQKGNYRKNRDAVHLWIERRERGLWTTGDAESAHRWFEGTAVDDDNLEDDPFADDDEEAG